MKKAFASALAVLLVAGCGGGDDSAPPPSTLHSVEYIVSGTGTANVTLENPGVGTVQVSNVLSGFTRSYFCTGTQFLYVSAQTNGSSAFSSVTVTIKKSGAIYKTNTSSGAFTIATASGSCN